MRCAAVHGKCLIVVLLSFESQDLMVVQALICMQALVDLRQKWINVNVVYWLRYVALYNGWAIARLTLKVSVKTNEIGICVFY